MPKPPPRTPILKSPKIPSRTPGVKVPKIPGIRKGGTRASPYDNFLPPKKKRPSGR